MDPVFDLDNQVILRDLFFHDEKEVSSTLQVSVNSLRRACRSVGLSRWPHTNHLQHATAHAMAQQRPEEAVSLGKRKLQGGHVLFSLGAKSQKHYPRGSPALEADGASEDGGDDADDDADDDASDSSDSDSDSEMDSSSSDSEVEAACLQELARQRAAKLSKLTPSFSDSRATCPGVTSLHASTSSHKKKSLTMNTNSREEVTDAGTQETGSSCVCCCSAQPSQKQQVSCCSNNSNCAASGSATATTLKTLLPMEHSGEHCRCHQHFSSETRQRVVAFIESRRQQHHMHVHRCEQQQQQHHPSCLSSAAEEKGDDTGLRGKRYTQDEQREALADLFRKAVPATRKELGDCMSVMPPMVVVPLFQDRPCVLPRWWFKSVEDCK